MRFTYIHVYLVFFLHTYTFTSSSSYIHTRLLSAFYIRTRLLRASYIRTRSVFYVHTLPLTYIHVYLVVCLHLGHSYAYSCTYCYGQRVSEGPIGGVSSGVGGVSSGVGGDSRCCGVGMRRDYLGGHPQRSALQLQLIKGTALAQPKTLPHEASWGPPWKPIKGTALAPPKKLPL